MPDLVGLANEARLFFMPMNLLVVLLLAGSYRTLLSTHAVGPRGALRFLHLMTIGWLGNLSYLLVEAAKYRLTLSSTLTTGSSVVSVIPAVSVLNSLALSLSTLASLLFIEASLELQAKFSNFKGLLRLLGISLAILPFLPLQEIVWYLLILVPNVLYNAAALILLARAVDDLTYPILGVGFQGVSMRIVLPLRLYAFLQLAYLLLWIPNAFGSINSQAVSSIAGAAGFAFAFAFKLIHLTGIVGYSAVRTIRLQRLGLEERTLQSQKRLISAMVHELKTPAAELNLQLDSLQSAALARQGVKEEINGVREIMTRLLSIVHGAYDLVNGNSERRTLDRPSTHNANNILQSAILSIKATLQAQRPEAYVTIETQLSQKPFVRFRRSELMQVFINVIKNAYDAMPSGGLIRVKTRRLRSTEDVPTKIVITITDTGEGIPLANLARVKEDGFTTRASQNDGRGHGLFISNSLVEANGGMLEIDSPASQSGGTTVRITLPEAPGSG
jgi:signal transduction histidine kinase